MRTIPGQFKYTVIYSDGTTEVMDSNNMNIETILYNISKCAVDKLTIELNPAWLAWPSHKI